MDPEVARQLIRRRLDEGRLPRGRMAEAAVRSGDGQLCDGCGAIVTTDQIAMSGLAVENWRTLEFHVDCFHIWDVERHLPAGHPV